MTKILDKKSENIIKLIFVKYEIEKYGETFLFWNLEVLTCTMFYIPPSPGYLPQHFELDF